MKKITSTIVKEFDKYGNITRQTETTVTEENDKFNYWTYPKITPYIPEPYRHPDIMKFTC